MSWQNHSFPTTPGMIPPFIPGSRADGIIDAVVIAMIVIVPIMWWSIWQARRGKRRLHRKVQSVLAMVLGIAVLIFEINVRLVGWQDGQADQSLLRHLGLPHAHHSYHHRLLHAAARIYLVFSAMRLAS